MLVSFTMSRSFFLILASDPSPVFHNYLEFLTVQYDIFSSLRRLIAKGYTPGRHSDCKSVKMLSETPCQISEQLLDLTLLSFTSQMIMWALGSVNSFFPLEYPHHRWRCCSLYLYFVDQVTGGCFAYAHSTVLIRGMASAHLFWSAHPRTRCHQRLRVRISEEGRETIVWSCSFHRSDWVSAPGSGKASTRLVSIFRGHSLSSNHLCVHNWWIYLRFSLLMSTTKYINKWQPKVLNIQCGLLVTLTTGVSQYT